MEVCYKTILLPKYPNGVQPEKYELVTPKLLDGSAWDKFSRYGEEYTEGTCCHQMRLCLDSSFITFGTNNPELVLSSSYWDYADEYKTETKINFCPWCGERITIKEVERIRRTPVEKKITRVEKITEYVDEKIEG